MSAVKNGKRAKATKAARRAKVTPEPTVEDRLLDMQRRLWRIESYLAGLGNGPVAPNRYYGLGQPTAALPKEVIERPPAPPPLNPGPLPE